MKGKVAISVKHVSKSFRLPQERYTGLKQAVVNLGRGKKYTRQPVLQNISFEIEKGDFFGIVGRNGSGKSTLLKLLAQIYTPDQGAVQVNGSLTPFIELGVGFNPELTGKENVYLNGALLGFDRTQMKSLYGAIVDFAELEPFMDQKLKNYSSGMQVRLAFSIAIRAESDILIIDEVLAVGDAAFQQKCYEYFEEMKRMERTLVLVTHDMNAVNRFCNKALIIENGKIKKIGKPEEVADTYLEDNIREGSELRATHQLSAVNTVSSKLVKGKGRLEIQIEFQSQTNEPLFAGISIIKDGISVAESNTLKELKLTGSGRVKYNVELKSFNSGVYALATALFKVKNRELIALGEEKHHFTVKDADISKGGALRLADGWRRE